MRDDTTRRDFLKAAGLAVAGIAGAASPSYAKQQEDDKKKKDDDKKKEEPNYDDLFGEDSGSGSKEEETRACPQCGALMYKQGNTWTCENCGYSYVE